MYKRISNLSFFSENTCFLWGTRQSGKSTLLKTLFPGAKHYDLLLSNEYSRLLQNPAFIREECSAKGITGKTQKEPGIIYEVQKLPALLDEVHWLIENRGVRFILCASDFL